MLVNLLEMLWHTEKNENLKPISTCDKNVERIVEDFQVAR